MQRKRFVFAITCIFPMSILATTYYVNPNIKVSSLAKIDAAKYGKVKNLPLPNIFSALNSVQPGDSVLLAGGVHRYTQSINFTIDGTPDKPITFASYPGETAVLDFSAAPLQKAAAVTVTASALAFNNVVYENASKHGCIVSGSNSVYTQCIFRNNGNKGCQVLGGHNQFINCDAYGNGKTDQADGDGFAPQLEDAGGNKFSGCRSWNNGDDGWDGYLKDDKTITDTLVNCWAITNGYDMQGKSTASNGGNGNGFKPGSETGYHNWVEINCLAAYNQQKGFDQNHSLATMTVINCTAFNNYKWNFVDYEAPASGHTYTFKNCISLRTSAITPLSPTVDNLYAQVVQSNDSWLTGFGPATATASPGVYRTRWQVTASPLAAISPNTLVADVQTTAEMLTFMSPYLFTADPQRAPTILSAIAANPATAQFAQVLAQNVSKADPLTDPAVQSAAQNAIAAVVQALAKKSASPNAVSLEPNAAAGSTSLSAMLAVTPYCWPGLTPPAGGGALPCLDLDYISNSALTPTSC